MPEAADRIQSTTPRKRVAPLDACQHPANRFGLQRTAGAANPRYVLIDLDYDTAEEAGAFLQFPRDPGLGQPGGLAGIGRDSAHEDPEPGIDRVIGRRLG